MMNPVQLFDPLAGDYSFIASSSYAAAMSEVFKLVFGTKGFENNRPWYANGIFGNG